MKNTSKKCPYCGEDLIFSGTAMINMETYHPEILTLKTFCCGKIVKVSPQICVFFPEVEKSDELEDDFGDTIDINDLERLELALQGASKTIEEGITIVRGELTDDSTIEIQSQNGSDIEEIIFDFSLGNKKEIITITEINLLKIIDFIDKLTTSPEEVKRDRISHFIRGCYWFRGSNLITILKERGFIEVYDSLIMGEDTVLVQNNLSHYIRFASEDFPDKVLTLGINPISLDLMLFIGADKIIDSVSSCSVNNFKQFINGQLN